MYARTFDTWEALTENAPYPVCHANSPRGGNSSWTHPEELALIARSTSDTALS
jgi:hypothetical protein